MLTFLRKTTCGGDRVTRLANEETIGEIVSISQPTTGGFRSSELPFCQFRSDFEMMTRLVEESFPQIELRELAMGFNQSHSVRSHFKNFLPRQPSDGMFAAVHGATRHFLQDEKSRIRINLGGPNVKRLTDEG
jgi:hypothetical protein